MKVLLLTYLFQNTYNKNSSAFFWDYAFALNNAGYDVKIISIIPISIRDIIRCKKIDFGKKVFVRSGIQVFIFQFPSIPIFKSINFFP